MLSKKHLFSLLCLTLLLKEERSFQGEARLQLNNQYVGDTTTTKLFVFGDSLADTGNTRKGLSSSITWKEPYGMTYPGEPSGRASDGRILTDYIATYLGVKSPIAYELRKQKPQDLKYYGVNLAYGGTGVFASPDVRPNMTSQIDILEQLIKDNVYSSTDLTYSVALLSVAGNDYGGDRPKKYINKGIPSYIASVVNQITINLKRINELGVKKIAVTGLGPLGCIPLSTAPFLFKHCNDLYTPYISLHNDLLNKAVAKLNNEAKGNSTFVVLDLYDSFNSILNNPLSNHFGQNPLIPCCIGVTIEDKCGDVDSEKKVKKYRVCDDPVSAFFWDLGHPTQAAWNAVYNKLRASNSLVPLHF